MRILLANEARAGGGGVETYLASLVPVLACGGHQFALLYANTAAEQGPTTIEIGDAWSVADEGLGPAVARAAAWNPDVVFAHNMRPLEVDEALARAAPVVKMMHGYAGTCVSGQKTREFPAPAPCTRACGPGCLVQYLPRRCGPRRPLLMARQYGWASRQRNLFDRYRAVVVASHHMRDEYVRNGVRRAHAHVVPMFVPAAATATPDAQRTVDVVFLGRITRLKGLDRAVRAVGLASRALDRPLRFAVAGDGPQRADAERLARATGVDAEFTGWLPAPARDALLARARVLVVPSVWPEPFGLVGLEAAQVGVPSVAFDVGGVREWLTHGVNGLLVALEGGDAALGDALARILGDASLHARLAAGARTMTRRFTPAAHLDALERIFAAARRP